MVDLEGAAPVLWTGARVRSDGRGVEALGHGRDGLGMPPGQGARLPEAPSTGAVTAWPRRDTGVCSAGSAPGCHQGDEGARSGVTASWRAIPSGLRMLAALTEFLAPYRAATSPR
jgi:hypothetical protein